MSASTESLEQSFQTLEELDVEDARYWGLIDQLVESRPLGPALVGLLGRRHTDRRLMVLADLLGRLVEANGQDIPQEASQLLTTWLHERSDPQALTATLAALRRLQAIDAADDVASVAGHSAADVRQQVAQTLPVLLAAGSASEVARETLLKQAHDRHPRVRAWATYGLSSVLDPTRDDEIQEVLRGLLNDPSEEVRCQALRGLARTGDAEALALALSECDVDRELLELAATASPNEPAHATLTALALDEEWIGDRELLQRALDATRPSSGVRPLTFLIFVDRSGGFRWRLIAANGRLLAEAPESYARRGEARNALAHLSSWLRNTVVAERVPERWVVPSQQGGWDVFAPDTQRASKHFERQQDAIARAREILRNSGGGELIIQNREGRIRESDTVPGKPKSQSSHDPVA